MADCRLRHRASHHGAGLPGDRELQQPRQSHPPASGHGSAPAWTAAEWPVTAGTCTPGSPAGSSRWAPGSTSHTRQALLWPVLMPVRIVRTGTTVAASSRTCESLAPEAWSGLPPECRPGEGLGRARRGDVLFAVLGDQRPVAAQLPGELARAVAGDGQSRAVLWPVRGEAAKHGERVRGGSELQNRALWRRPAGPRRLARPALRVTQRDCSVTSPRRPLPSIWRPSWSTWMSIRAAPERALCRSGERSPRPVVRLPDRRQIPRADAGKYPEPGGGRSEDHNGSRQARQASRKDLCRLRPRESLRTGLTGHLRLPPGPRLAGRALVSHLRSSTATWWRTRREGSRQRQRAS